MNDETISFEDRIYVNPEVSMAEQEQFMEKFRNVQGQNQSQINRDTYNLGTPVSSNLGGLTGAEGLWNVQYQRPAVNAAIENLRQVNMQQAVNTAMQNQQNAIANRLNQTKRAYYRAQQEASARDRANANQPSNTPDNSKLGSIDVEGLQEGTGTGTITSNAPGTATTTTPSGVTGNTPDFGVYNPEGGQPLYSTEEGKNTSVSTEDISFWDINRPQDWLGWLLGLAGKKEYTKK